MLDSITMRRLALIRYLHSSAEEESRKTDPFGLTSILGFHDCVELFLDLACDYLSVTEKVGEFKHYWKFLEQKLNGAVLSQKRTMERLNESRKAFKHHGTLPSSFDIEKFRSSVADFFEENTSTIFNIEFNSISLHTLVQNGKVKSLLCDVDILLKQNERQEAIDKIAVAFAQLLGDARQTKFGWRHESLFFLDSASNRLSSGDTKDLNKNFVRHVNSLDTTVKELQEAMSIFTLGFDYQKYIKFKLWTPRTVLYMGQTEYQVPGRLNSDQKIEGPSIEVCRFCYDFVVNCAIQLQNLDFEIQM